MLRRSDATAGNVNYRSIPRPVAARNWPPSNLEPAIDLPELPALTSLPAGAHKADKEADFLLLELEPGIGSDTIRCRLKTANLAQQLPDFTALSYCWQSSLPRRTIICEGRSIEVTGNLHSALHSLRNPFSKQLFWIDQLCIDQSNIKERNRQVRNMGSIFRSASKVLVWLGPEGPHTHQAMLLPDKVAQQCPSLLEDLSGLADQLETANSFPPVDKEPWCSFRDLLERPWFRRVWVIQEVVCAKSITMRCGRASSSWSNFVALAQAVDAWKYSSAGAAHAIGIKRAAQHLALMEELRDFTSCGTRTATGPFTSDSLTPLVLSVVKDCGATDLRDKLYAFHDLLRLWDDPDYNISVPTLYRSFACKYVSMTWPDTTTIPFELFQTQINFILSAGTCNQNQRLPSWVPDWSASWRARPFHLGSSFYCAGGKYPMPLNLVTDSAVGVLSRERFELEVSLQRVDEIAAVSDHALACEETMSVATLQTHLKNWLRNARRLLQISDPLNKSFYKDNALAFARTIFADQFNGVQTSSGRIMERYSDMLDFLADTELPDIAIGSSEDFQALYYSVTSFLRGRVFVVTKLGRYGLAQDGVSKYDFVGLIDGAPVPVAMRYLYDLEQAEGHHLPVYQLLCEAFVLGIMEGEAWDYDHIMSPSMLV